MQGGSRPSRLAQCAALDNRILAEFRANFVGGLFGLRTFSRVGVQQITFAVGVGIRRDFRQSDPQQAERPAMADLIEQSTRRAIHRIGDLRGVMQALPLRDQPEVRGLEFERHHPPRFAFGLGARRHFFGHAPEVPVEDVDIAGIFVKSCFI